ncbi:MAG: hypothetical protein ACYDDF_03115 [Thermoplasmatota archaeon]
MPICPEGIAKAHEQLVHALGAVDRHAMWRPIEDQEAELPRALRAGSYAEMATAAITDVKENWKRYRARMRGVP